MGWMGSKGSKRVISMTPGAASVHCSSPFRPYGPKRAAGSLRPTISRAGCLRVRLNSWGLEAARGPSLPDTTPAGTGQPPTASQASPDDVVELDAQAIVSNLLGREVSREEAEAIFHEDFGGKDTQARQLLLANGLDQATLNSLARSQWIQLDRPIQTLRALFAATSEDLSLLEGIGKVRFAKCEAARWVWPSNRVRVPGVITS